MEDQRVTPEDLDAALEADYKALKARICDAVNKARIGRIIADSEEPVPDAHAVFRQQAYQKAIDLLGQRLAQEDFSPSAHTARLQVKEQGQAGDLSPDRQRRIERG
jgi:hypothetical protein